jgi:hypothetical protein
MTGTARPSKGVRREAESEGSWGLILGLDEQKADTRPARLGNPAMDGDARAEKAVATWCERQRVEYGLAEFSGAWRLAPMVRYKQACVFVRESASHDILADLMKTLAAKPVETGSILAVLVSSDGSVFFDSTEAEGIHALSPVQLYLRLGHSAGAGKRGRCRAASPGAQAKLRAGDAASR